MRVIFSTFAIFQVIFVESVPSVIQPMRHFVTITSHDGSILGDEENHGNLEVTLGYTFAMLFSV